MHFISGHRNPVKICKVKQLHFSIGILLTVFFMAGTGRQLYSNGKITELVKKPLNNDQLIYPALVNKFYQMNGISYSGLPAVKSFRCSDSNYLTLLIPPFIMA
jgi:hypothetical protein